MPSKNHFLKAINIIDIELINVPTATIAIMKSFMDKPLF